MTNIATLQELRGCVEKLTAKGEKIEYRIPSLWQSPSSQPGVVKVNPFTFWKEQIDKILAMAAPEAKDKIRPQDAIIYNMFVRLTTAFDHNGNGVVDTPLSADGLRETGTFAKSIALLPYLKFLGVNTVYCLPITAIGKFGNKGDLGSPYAIRNPYVLDDLQCEPALGLGAEKEFKALVEAAHHLGMKVVLEFVLRTTAKDSDWMRQHPEWFYWIDDQVPERKPGGTSENEYGAPVFTAEELKSIHAAVEAHQLDNLVAPHDIYRQMFTEPPAPNQVQAGKEGGYIAKVGKRTVKIPGAFADWPPDDTQPPWNDVTYLRMYHHADYNYIAYNTIRMYDTRLAKAEHANKPLWDELIRVVPHYQDNFGVDGVMIDMGHALPSQLKEQMIQAARAKNPNFLFWDENFRILEKTKQEGYNAVVGYLCFDQYDPGRHRAFLESLAKTGVPLPFFGTPENHNTPRAATRNGGTTFSRLSWVVNSFLPCLPFIHAGFELGQTLPVNTGLGFTADDLKKYPTAVLPLFSKSAYTWEKADSLTSWIHKISQIRQKYARLIVNPDPKTFVMMAADNDHVVAFARCSPDKKKCLVVVVNLDCTKKQEARLVVATKKTRLEDLVSRQHSVVHKDKVSLVLDPGGCKIFAL